MWEPQPGPQAEAIIATWCSTLFFGGARGGGKSDYLIADYLQDVNRYARNWQGVIFRRTYPELQEIVKRTQDLLPPTGAIWREQDKEWRWPNGATLHLRYLEHSRDASRYQGHEYCVAVGTLIQMADGTSKPIELCKEGELILTLEGARRILKKFQPSYKECCKAETALGSQIHPLNHPILCKDGWKSYASIAGISAKESSSSHLESLQLPIVDILARLWQPDPQSKTRSDSSISKVSPNACKSRAQFGATFLKVLKRFLEILYHSAPISLLSRLSQGSLSYYHSCYAGAYEHFGLLRAANCQCNYQSLYYSNDELSQLELGSDLKTAPVQVDAGVHSPSYRISDAQGNIPSDSHLCANEYLHPYDGSVRHASEKSFYGACRLTPIGRHEVVDITVEDCAHYITPNAGIVNRNCWIGWDEITQWPTDEGFRMLTACLRCSRAEVPTKRIRASGNPGGPGHQWVKALFIDHNAMGYDPWKDPLTGMWTMFIPSKVTDNQILLKQDPFYVERLKGVGSEALVRSWLDGDWNQVTGAYYTEFNDLHIVAPHEIDKSWGRFRSIDWGSARPFSVGWYAISDGSDIRYPKNALIKYREWYGASSPNVGLKLPVEMVAQGILARGLERVDYSISDPAIFQTDGGPSIAETFKRHGIIFRPGDNKRVAGWEQVRSRLIGEDSKPMLYFFSTCRDTIRTLPAAQHSSNKPEDIDTDGEDHALDELRYACMSRPYARPIATPRAIRTVHDMTLNDLWESNKHNRESRI